MATIKENLHLWTTYKWPEDGDEWSKPWGDGGTLWYGTILPRIRTVAEAPHILEIAPGYGRCTQYLARMCKKLTVVDLAENCIKECRKKFSCYDHIDYRLNDGKSLAFLADSSIDFVFSWDSLVHANDEVFASYVKFLGKKIKPGGFGFLHHSNMGSYRDPATGAMTAESRHWRDTTMSAKLFREYCAEAGLKCLSQEIVEWEAGVKSDVFSFFTREDGAYRFGETKIFENTAFNLEVDNLRRIHSCFHPPSLQMDKEIV